MIRDEHIQTLMDLGLTFLEAKTYLNTVLLRKADAATIAKASNVARQNVYRIMPVLENLGLAKKILSKPTMYQATTIKEGILILFQKRKTEYSKLQTKTSSLLNDFPDNNESKIGSPEGDSEFVITSEISLLKKMLSRLTLKSQRTIESIVPSLFFGEYLSDQTPDLKKAIKKGVKVRLITEKIDLASISKTSRFFEENPLVELKYLSNTIPLNVGILSMHIFDSEEMTLCISPRKRVPCLWSNNPQLLEICMMFFEDLWNNDVELRSLSHS